MREGGREGENEGGGEGRGGMRVCDCLQRD